MTCPVCGASVDDFQVRCPFCGSNILKERFYAENETPFKDEFEMIISVNANKARFSFTRANAVSIASTSNRMLTLYPFIASIIAAIIILIMCIKTHNYIPLIFIPIVYISFFTRANVGILYFIGLICAIVFKLPVEIITGIACCLGARLLYIYWMNLCKTTAQRVLLDNIEDFYTMWYNREVALIIDGNVILHRGNVPNI